MAESQLEQLKKLQPDQHKYEFNVSMSCGGCSKAVDNVLNKLQGELYSEEDKASGKPNKGVVEYSVWLKDPKPETVTVVAGPDLSYETVLTRIAKTGKKVKSAAELKINEETVEAVKLSTEIPPAA